MTTIDAKTLLNFLASGAEVLADDPEILADDSDGFAPDPDRCAALAEELARLADEFGTELELALELATANGLVPPSRSDR